VNAILLTPIPRTSEIGPALSGRCTDRSVQTDGHPSAVGAECYGEFEGNVTRSMQVLASGYGLAA
jgi:hypothetical protein